MINLIIPPISDCFMPTLGIAQLAGYLKNHGIECRIYDASAEFFYRLFTSDTDRSNREKYTYRNLRKCVERFSDKYENFTVKIDGFQTDFEWRDQERLLEYIENETVLAGEFEKLSFISREDGKKDSQRYFGLSISYECQVIPAIILAKVIKEKIRDAKICIGGSLLYNYENDFYKLFYASELIDILIVGAGEEALKYAALGRLEEFDKKYGVSVSASGKRYIIDTRGMTVGIVVYEPDFSDINFKYYPAAEKAFPYIIKDRCYYGKCYFCNGDKVGKQKSEKDIAYAFECIKKIAVKTGIKNVYIVDAALSPRDLKVIADMTIEPKISWIANGRFEKKLLDERLISQIAENGCVMLRFGLESASQKVLNLMNKGTDISDAEKILSLTAKYGIKNHVYLMFGYPGETGEDRKITLDFAERNKEVISSYSVSIFQPIPGTVVYRELLREVGDGKDAYKRMMDKLYEEGHYKEIYDDISKLNDLLRGYTRTNTEYYSANIFNTYAEAGDELLIKNDDLATEEKVNREISIQFSPKMD